MESSVIPSFRKSLQRWLLCCLLMVAAMVTVGGLTRLTESGLSMVRWQPLHVLPPLGEAGWAEEFSHYQQSPQYKQVNRGMTVEEFKNIFWLEYIHRLLGRITGLVFALPFLVFLLARKLPAPLAWRLGGIFLLGGAQGLMGWYMVKSGLAEVPWVSPLRLMAHLTLAFVIFALLLWHWLRLRWPAPSVLTSTTRTMPLGASLFLLALGQAMLGALVAGQDAGLLYDTFPAMNGEWIPHGVWLLDPWYRNLYENGTAAHFLHRLGALILTIALLAAAPAWLRRSRDSLPLRRSVLAVYVLLALQITLGALTVIHHVPIVIATLHQVAALILTGALLACAYFERHSGAHITAPQNETAARSDIKQSLGIPS